MLAAPWPGEAVFQALADAAQEHYDEATVPAAKQLWRMQELAGPQMAAQRKGTATAIEAFRREVAGATAAFLGRGVFGFEGSGVAVAPSAGVCDGEVCAVPSA